MSLFKKKKKKKKEITDLDRIINAKKDIFWFLLMVEVLLVPNILTYLSKKDMLNLATEIPLALVCSFILIAGPHFLYPYLEDYFSAFDGRDERQSPDKRAKAAFTYNVVYFMSFSIIAFFLAAAVSAFVFHKNDAAHVFLLVFFNVCALYISRWLTNRKYKCFKKKKKER